LKIDWAIILLQTTDKTVLEISEELGYSSLSHFCKLFRAQTGETPRKFRTSDKNISSEEN
jgi:AraC-like DNA-binding protein